MKIPGQNSITERIQWGFAIFLVVIVAGSISQWYNLSRLQRRLTVGEITAEFVDAILEARRYEKNWFLYRDPDALENNRYQVQKVRRIISRYKKEFSDLYESSPLLRKIEAEIDLYDHLMEQLSGQNDSKQLANLESRIREQGQLLIANLERFRKEEHWQMKKSLDSAIFITILFSILAAFVSMVMGTYMVDGVVTPLRQLVQCMEEIAHGNFTLCKEKNYAETIEIRAIQEALVAMLTELNRRKREAIQSEKLVALGTLVAGAAHEINNPISNILSSAEIIKEELAEEEYDRDFIQEMVDQILDQGDRAKHIVSSLLLFTRDKKIQPSMVRIRDLLQETRDILAVDVPDAVNLEVRVDQDGSVMIDREKIEQALLNLLRNAIHAVNGQGNILLWGNVDRNAGKIIFRVEDDGSGMTEDVMKRIFDPFFTTKEVGEGSGLGLSVVHEIVVKHGGKIWVDSEEGKGSVFTIELPLSDTIESV